MHQYGAAKHLLGQAAVWKEGVPASSCSVEGTRKTSRLIFHLYRFRVSYTDEKGNLHTGDLEVETIFSSINHSREPVVRYLKEAPDKFALSWEVEVQIAAWISWVFFSAVAIMFACCIFAARFLFNELRHAFYCAQNSDEVILTITKVTKEYRRGKYNVVVYHYTGENKQGLKLKGKARFSERYQPLFADSSRTTMVGLVSMQAPDRPVVLRADLMPFNSNGSTASKMFKS